MSEYTEYFIVKSKSEKNVREKLNQAKIISIVHADIEDEFFDEEFKRNGEYQWVSVSAPAEYGEHSYKNKFDDISKLFDVVVLYYQDEYFNNWNLKIKSHNDYVNIDVVEDKKINLNDKEIQILETVFDRKWSELKPLLKNEISYKFLNYVGIPYFEMNAQDFISGISGIPEGDTYSFLGSEFTD